MVGIVVWLTHRPITIEHRAEAGGLRQRFHQSTRPEDRLRQTIGVRIDAGPWKPPFDRAIGETPAAEHLTMYVSEHMRGKRNAGRETFVDDTSPSGYAA